MSYGTLIKNQTNKILSELNEINTQKTIEDWLLLNKISDLESRVKLKLHSYTSLVLLGNTKIDLPNKFYKITGKPMILLENKILDELWYSIIPHSVNKNWDIMNTILNEFEKKGRKIISVNELVTTPKTVNNIIDSDLIEYKMIGEIQKTRKSDVNIIKNRITTLKLKPNERYKKYSIDKLIILQKECLEKTDCLRNVSGSFDVKKYKDQLDVLNILNNEISKKHWNKGEVNLHELFNLSNMYPNHKYEILFLKYGFYSSTKYDDLISFSLELTKIYLNRKDYKNSLIWYSITKGYNDGTFNNSKIELNSLLIDIFKGIGDYTNAFEVATKYMNQSIDKGFEFSKEKYLDLVLSNLNHQINNTNHIGAIETISLAFGKVPNEIESISNNIGNLILRENEKLVEQNEIQEKKIEALLIQLNSTIDHVADADDLLHNKELLDISKQFEMFWKEDNEFVKFNYNKIYDDNVISCIKESLALYNIYNHHSSKFVDWTAPMILIVKAFETYIRGRLSNIFGNAFQNNIYKTLGQLIQYIAQKKQDIVIKYHIDSIKVENVVHVGKEIYIKYRNGYVHEASQKMKKKSYEEMLILLYEKDMFYW